nr:mycofactocin biosynthesis glycosyltransferase MftF [Kineococcus aurantiacus]
MPHGSRVVLTRDVKALDGGRVLAGGSPLTAVQLSDAAAQVLRGWAVPVQDDTSAAVADRLLALDLADPRFDDGPATTATARDLTVVVPVRDRTTPLDRCLSALAPLRVVVVDDGSHDPAAVAAVVHRHGAGLIALPENHGPAAARNAGLRQVRTPLVAFVDSDVRAPAEVLRRLGREFADPALDLVGPRVVPAPRAGRVRWFHRYDEIASSLDMGPAAGRVRPGARLSYLPSACLVARTASLAPGFAPELRVGEDVDLVWRLAAAGGVVRYVPRYVVRHDSRDTFREWFATKFSYGSGGADLGRRHGPLIAPAVLTGPTAAVAVAVLLRRRWGVPVVLGAIALTAVRSARRLPRSEGRHRLALTLSAGAALGGVHQASSLLLRAWWPVVWPLALVSRTVRRAVTTAVVVDVVSARHAHPREPLLRTLLGRRLDDLAYGAGLWVGALRERQLSCLAVVRPRRRG